MARQSFIKPHKIYSCMICDAAERLCEIKAEFVKLYTGRAHIQEIIPLSLESHIDHIHLEHLHAFAQSNPIYHNHYQDKFAGADCTVYEGDINQYWLDSTKHGSSCQPFYPTWIVSAYLMVSLARSLGYSELVDVGSGDGRLSFCASILRMRTHSIEIDEGLADLQNTISKKTGQDFGAICADALVFDYNLDLKRPIFFVGGLPQMGGDVLASDLISKIHDKMQDCGIVFAGTMSKRALATNDNEGGWSPLITKHDLEIQSVLSLPTVWTFDQIHNTPFIYTRFRSH